eukprot:CAMPEP_0172313562 /NCGR_PEP_ID=MMETSP1058-20130122/20446_1 /TAXON_ID=83371 /ORGANISM="Detonula confervacea, Strain CCMP 353" /LENGTH=949 /DNA_ID=CAMNT_0013027225 /DNA_START=52 /DNA_END=2898 /DNA_ORIENTATION=-
MTSSRKQTENETNAAQAGARIRRKGQYLSSICCIIAILCVIPPSCSAFAPSIKHTKTLTLTPLQATQQPNQNSQGGKKKRKPPNKYKTIGDMMTAMEKNPDAFLKEGGGRRVNANGRFIDTKQKTKRSRSRVDRPKQQYLYASQRRALDLEQSPTTGKKQKNTAARNSHDMDGAVAMDMMEGEDGTFEESAVSSSMHPQQQQQLLIQQRQEKQLEFVRSLGLNPATQVADPIVGDSLEDVPRIVGIVRVDGNNNSDDDDDDDDVEDTVTTTTSNSFAYVMYKPAGWSILGDKNKKKGNKKKMVEPPMPTATQSAEMPPSKEESKNGNIKKVKAYDEETDDFYFVEYNDDDIMAVMTPEERAELMKEGGLNLDDDMADMAKGALAGTEWDDGLNDDGTKKKKKKKTKTPQSAEAAAAPPTAPLNTAARMYANINTTTRPSLVNWLKQLKAAEGTPIKGGKNWVATAGATDIDDSGLVLLCPRDRTDAVHVDRCGYVAVVGNGKKLVSRSKLFKSAAKGSGGEVFDDSTAQIEISSRLKRGRDVDPVLTVSVNFPDGASTCAHAVLLCQDKFGDGVRGDALGDPFDRRSSRRLVHCESMAVTSLVNLDDEQAVVIEECDLPDDVANYANRREAVFSHGSFLGRQGGLAQNGLTNAYREINGAADGFPGWIVDRYDKWLFVQQAEEGPMTMDRGPIPSLHDGRTSGVYYLPTKADRSVMGTTEKVKPTLLEGQETPSEFIPVMENGINYQVHLGDSFSTGIFLDQRLQRAWLAELCNEETRVLNCFAHTGAFSVAAATAGAKTVSLDLDKKWLDRVRPQMEANGIMEWEGQHDCIYGDCFDWLARLAKRGEQFDIVILDPPSTSVGKKKKRWSVKNDMAELVALAAPLVKSNGLLFTTTNSATLRADKFAKMCKQGLMDAGIQNPKLERVSPMPSDFLSIGSQPVKNLVWRI